MTYAGFLALFVIPPLIAAALLAWRQGRGRALSTAAAAGLLVHVGLALAYTTPWDNYLVATRVWWYDPARVLGLTFGWVPLEEYLFFVLQTLLTGLVLITLLGRKPAPTAAGPARLRLWGPAALAAGWLAAVAALGAGWRPAAYLGLELAWALPPIALQLAVGADIIWRRREAIWTLVCVSVYLCAADLVAIGLGVWTIDPAQSLGIKLFGILPLEEMVFFFVTNLLVVQGLTLALDPETWARWRALKAGPAGRPPFLARKT